MIHRPNWPGWVLFFVSSVALVPLMVAIGLHYTGYGVLSWALWVAIGALMLGLLVIVLRYAADGRA
jgi:hypothetical protein